MAVEVQLVEDIKKGQADCVVFEGLSPVVHEERVSSLTCTGLGLKPWESGLSVQESFYKPAEFLIGKDWPLGSPSRKKTYTIYQ
jgi:hypothetical protein